MAFEATAFRLLALLLVFRLALATPLDDDPASHPPRRRTATKPSRLSSRPLPPQRDIDEDAPPVSESWRRDYGIDEKDDDTADLKARTVAPADFPNEREHSGKGERTASQHALAGGFFEAVRRFLGLDEKGGKGRRKTSADEGAHDEDDIPSGAQYRKDKASKPHHGFSVYDDADSDDVADNVQRMAKGAMASTQPSSTRTRGGRYSDQPSVSEHSDGGSDGGASRVRSEEERETEPLVRRAERPKTRADDLLSTAEMREMVRVFHKLFQSLEWSLERSPDAQAGVRASRTVLGAAKEEGAVRKSREELPDVDGALAEAARLNRKREAERATRMAADDAGNGGADGEEDEGEEVAGMPRSAPAYGVRQRERRVLRGRERTREESEEERRVLETAVRLSEVGSIS